MPTKNLSHLRVALVHDWLFTRRGGERVLESILELFPEAHIYTLFYRPGNLGPQIENKKIFTSFLNKLPGVQKYYRYLLPLFPMAIEQFSFKDYDLVISTSHCVAKGVIVPPDVPHFCYCFSPMRYVWDQKEYYFKKNFFPIELCLHYLRLWDVSSHPRVNVFFSNSNWVAARIQKYYGRKAQAIYSPVDVDFYQPKYSKKDFYLVVSAFVPYKRIELAVEACKQLDKPLIVIGSGPEESKLRKIAGPKTTFLGFSSDEELRKHYSQAKALLFPGIEDFGIVPIEAMACGTPVIAYGRGGVIETIREGETGTFFHEPTADSLMRAILRFETQMSLSPEKCRLHALQFGNKRFQLEFLNALEKNLSYSAPFTFLKETEPS